MFSQLQSYWLYGGTYCSIEVSSKEGQDVFYRTTAKQKKGEFTSIKFYQTKTLISVTEQLSKGQHTYLIVNSDKVLIKEVPTDENVQTMVANAFPSLSLQDFYFEVIELQNTSMISVCRKDYVESLLSEFKKMDIIVLGFQLGFQPLIHIIPFLKDKTVNAGNYHLSLRSGQIVSYSKGIQQETYYEIGDEQVSSNYLLSLGGLFNYTSKSISRPSNINAYNQELLKYYSQRNFFKKASRIGVVLILLLLLINFLIFNFYYSKYSKLSAVVEMRENQEAINEVKLKDIQRKEQLIENIFNSGSSKSSYYINRIVLSKPETILFDQFIYQPIDRTIRPDKPILYESNIIVINGQSNEKNNFSTWIQKLEKFDWIHTVTVINYSNENKSTDKFEIQIEINNDLPK